MRMMVFGLLTLIGISLMANTATPENSYSSTGPGRDYNFQGTWRMGLDAVKSSDEISNQRTQSTLNLQAHLNFIFSSWLSMNITPNLKYRTGFIQMDANSQLENSIFDVKNASVDLTPVSVLQLSAGALNQRYMHSPLVFADRAFPATRLQLSSDEENIFSMGFRGQTAVPTSTAFSGTAQEKEATPSLNSVSIFGRLKTAQTQGQLAISAFQFKNLPLSISTKSGLLGNDVINVNSTDSSFAYEFQAVEIRTHLNWNLSPRFIYKLELSTVRNSAAPADMNQAYWIQNSLAFILNDKWSLIPSYEFFRIEPDAVVAVYNEDYMNSNRNGFLAGLTLQWKKWIRFSFKAGTREALFEKISQPRENIMILSAETLHVGF